MKKILFVCTGNTCRSPMAQAIFEKLSPDGYSAFSAGITASNGQPVSENSIKALELIGIKIDHTSHRINQNMIEEYDIIVGITANHAQMLKQMFPEFSDKIYAFPTDVSDPYGRNLDEYVKCRDMISKGVEAILKVI